MGVLTGDFVFVGDVGRPDLLETAAGEAGSMVPSARSLYASIQRFRALPPELQVWPGHGAGSACGKALGAVPVSTVGYEVAVNPSLLAATGEDAFVGYILDGQVEPPPYFARMKRQNREGPRPLGAMPRPRRVRDGKLTELCGATGVAVLDTRPWPAYRDGHLPGALFAPLDADFSTVAGSYVPDGMAVYLIIEAERLDETIVDLVHVGLDNIVGFATPEMFVDYASGGGKIARVQEVEAATLEDLAAAGAFLLDVRGASEIGAAGAVPGAHHIAHTGLLARIDEVPKDRPVVALCQTGSRSTVAAGLLDRFGRRAVHLAGGVAAWSAHTGGAADAG
jgi:hydroxyacylglutathione hydrolase